MEKHLFEEITESVTNEYNDMEETSRRQKAQQAINGKLKNIKTICIMSAENPMGNALSPEENKQRRTELEMYLKNANYSWFRIKGKYGNDEKSHMIYNITLHDAEKVGKMFNQESIIFIRIEGDGKITYQYLEKIGDGDYNVTHERSEYVDMTDADDFFSSIGRKFKFQIPFFDGSDEEVDAMVAEHVRKINGKIESKCLTEERIEHYLSNAVNEEKTEKCRWEARGNLFGGWSE